MKQKIIIDLYRSILRKSKNIVGDIDLSKGILTSQDFNYIDSVFVDRYIVDKYDINTFVAGPYQSRPLNIISWIKHQIRQKATTQKNVDTLFQVHLDLREILTISKNHPVIRNEY